MKFLKEAEVEGKRVLVRADFNVTLDSRGRVLDDFRIRATLPTIQHLIEKKAKVVLAAHLGRPEGKKVKELTLAPIAKNLSQLLGKKIDFVSDCVGQEAKKASLSLKPGQILLLENLRFYPGEEENDKDFAAQLAELAEVYVNDGFGVSHRAHASVEAITKNLPSFAGLLLEREIREIGEVEVMFPREANSVFVKMPEAVIESLRRKGWKFYTFIGVGGARFMCSWDTREEKVRALVEDLKASIVEAR